MCRLLLFAVIVLIASYDVSPAGAQGFAGLGQNSPDYQQAERETKLSFPRDHDAHPGFRIEWWYVTANLETETGEQLGLQWTLFRQAFSPQKSVDGWSNQTFWMGHAGVTTRKKHYSAERFGRGGIGQAGVKAGEKEETFVAWIDNWQAANPEDTSLRTLDVRASADAFSYDIRLTTDRSPTLQGVDGYSVKSQSGQASHYYSHPFYQLTGSVIVDGKRMEVTGKAWLDREWSSQPLAEDQTGWDWFSLHLSDDEKLMLFRLRSSTGEAFYSGNHIFSDGRTEPLDNGQITISPIQHTRINGHRVPTRWRVSIPSMDLNLTTKALNRNSMMDTVFSYWEGPISFTGSHEGVGYLEMTGY